MAFADPGRPAVSVVMPVYNAEPHLERALRSVAGQTLGDWELVAVDDGSTDRSLDVLRRYADRDPRVRVVALPDNGGPGRARNRGLRAAAGDVIAYLDADDEFYPDHLERARDWAWRADVLLFRYDVVTPTPGGEAVRPWDPAPHLPNLWAKNVSTPLGVTHRRAALDWVGGFDEALRFEGDWDLWKRLAAAGATVLCVPFPSGRYHVRAGSVSRTAANRVPAGPGDVPIPAGPVPPGRVLFASYHCYLDTASGAAVGSRALLEGLAARGWACEAVCGPRLDDDRAASLAAVYGRLGVVPEVAPAGGRGDPATVARAVVGGVPVTTFEPARPGCHRAPDDAEATRFAALVEREVRRFRPDVVRTYGGLAVTRWVIDAARRSGARVVFALHNLAYERADLFRSVDAVVTPSRFAAGYYRRTLGVASAVVPSPWDWGRVVFDGPPGRHLTFVNPIPDKGVYWFAGLARDLAARRPDIPLLVVDGRGTLAGLREQGLDLEALPTVQVVGPTATPADFYRESRAVLVPSLVDESFCRVAAEAICNGLPVIASDRGALPETVADLGVVLDIPARYTPKSAGVPGPDEVRPWVDAVERAWDREDPGERQRRRERAAAVWDADRLVAADAAVMHAAGQSPGPFYRTPSAE